MAAKKSRGLGRGLDALFGDMEVDILKNDNEDTPKVEESGTAANKPSAGSAAKRTADSSENAAKAGESGGSVQNVDPAAGGILYIDINDIKPNTNQPRKVFDEEKLEDLAASIQEHGLIQPVVLRSVGAGYEIVAGERRWRAARKAGVRNIPCIVRELSDEENMLLAIIENMQREDLNPIEEAEGINQMIETYGLTQDQVSKSVGKSRPYITNCLRLLKLPEAIQSFVSEGQLSAGHARAIVSAGNKEKQIALAEKAVKEGLSVRQIEKLAKDSKTGKAKAKPREKNADVKRVENDLKEALGTKVTLNQKGKKGKIEIEYYSKDDLERLIELLKTLH
ncbi:ParB/RepB/Spo0J family partition protein [Lentihominibacter faecis]|nr:ParB/RepB/Spo0J family partition protein [Lentihominibacter faecis]